MTGHDRRREQKGAEGAEGARPGGALRGMLPGRCAHTNGDRWRGGRVKAPRFSRRSKPIRCAPLALPRLFLPHLYSPRRGKAARRENAAVCDFYGVRTRQLSCFRGSFRLSHLSPIESPHAVHPIRMEILESAR